MQKLRFYLCFSVVYVPSFRSFRGSYGGVRIALSVAFADGFMPRKVLVVRKECVRLSKCDVVVTSTIISYAVKKREWVEVGFAWIFDVFRE